ncbi:hypothetical protein QVD99_007075 [Batrachochytrium dendrobatidis]|uniref:Uncharacterized protein n=1 Tax=Batrachochytrium dendrobatidis (strain JEL423) TaxID=403673 RepID=A0A177WT85_BATDL|nr:hypothetical protein QVD99_007075 [Batrachochytrium dendrobatidis]OAJ43122.1 hypothetical protein BDEG_26503 [Batrachochytrium dendrobatidis JEL423]
MHLYRPGSSGAFDMPVIDSDGVVSHSYQHSHPQTEAFHMNAPVPNSAGLQFGIGNPPFSIDRQAQLQTPSFGGPMACAVPFHLNPSPINFSFVSGPVCVPATPPPDSDMLQPKAIHSIITHHSQSQPQSITHTSSMQQSFRPQSRKGEPQLFQHHHPARFVSIPIYDSQSAPIHAMVPTVASPVEPSVTVPSQNLPLLVQPSSLITFEFKPSPESTLTKPNVQEGCSGNVQFVKENDKQKPFESTVPLAALEPNTSLLAAAVVHPLHSHPKSPLLTDTAFPQPMLVTQSDLSPPNMTPCTPDLKTASLPSSSIISKDDLNAILKSEKKTPLAPKDVGSSVETLLLDNEDEIIYVLPSHRDGEDVMSLADSDCVASNGPEMNQISSMDELDGDYNRVGCRDDDWELL